MPMTLPVGIASILSFTWLAGTLSLAISLREGCSLSHAVRIRMGTSEIRKIVNGLIARTGFKNHTELIASP
jgi:hypothetical protein